MCCSNKAPGFGQVHIGESARGGYLPLLTALLDRTAESSLHASTAIGDVSAVRRALRLDAARSKETDPLIQERWGHEQMDRGGATPLQHAIDTGGNVRIVRALPDRGAAFDPGALAGLYRQLQRKDGDRLEIAEMFWSSDAIDGEEVLACGFHSHAAQGIAGIVEWHLDRGADVDLRDESGRTALHWVCNARRTRRWPACSWLAVRERS